MTHRIRWPFMTEKNQTAVSASVLAELFKVDERTIRKLATAGIVVRVGRGFYDRDASTTNYIVHLRELAAGRSRHAASAIAELNRLHAELLKLRPAGEDSDA
jgi:phage terminase Nu1 subunit (DNA packaging protein)